MSDVLLNDVFQDAFDALHADIVKVCEGMPQLFGDPVPSVYKTMHDTDDPNAVALYAAPANLSTQGEATGLACRYTFDIQCFVRAVSSDELSCQQRASHLANVLLLIALADPRLGNTVDRVDASISDWNYGEDNQKLNTTLVQINYRCVVVNQDVSAIKTLLED